MTRRALLAVATALALGWLSGCGSTTTTTAGLDSKAQSPAATGATDGAKQTYFVRFGKQPAAAEEGLVRNHGGQMRHTYHLVPAIAADLTEGEAAELAKQPGVKAVEPDTEVLALDTELDNSWGVKRIGGGTAYTGGFKGTGVKVAVLDTGIDYNHTDLAGNYAGGKDFVNNDADPMDDNGHGTHVAGIIAALKNGVGVQGVAPEAQLYALKVLGASGSGSFTNVVAALQWCVDNQIQVTNLSLGSKRDPGTTVRNAFANAAGAGVINVAAAGNSGNRRGSGNSVEYPAAYPTVVAVAATDQNNLRASFSSTGAKVELSAPGVSILSTRLGGGTVAMSGTSMACPHAAGAVAVCLGAGKTNVVSLLDSTATNLGVSGRDNLYGYGLVNLAAALGL